MTRVKASLKGSCRRPCRSRYSPSNRAANQSSKTAQPCHLMGGPHPHPYLFAGNQNDLPFGTAPSDGGLTDELRGRVEAPDQSRGRTISSRARGDTTASHGPLQRLLDGAAESASLVALRRVITNRLSRPAPQRRPQIHGAYDNQDHAQRDRKIQLRPVPGATEQAPSASGK
jgi:hypothetical protein